MRLELLAPAKLNLALEITGRRADGYHELVSFMHTIALCDFVQFTEAPALELRVTGEEARGVPRDGSENLAFAAAQALAKAAGEPRLGALIELEKHIPAGMGLGGGSADAAAVLRGLDRLWGLGFSAEQLCEIGARIGSDVPFCVLGGAAMVTGRGEHVEALPDALEMPLTLFAPDVEVPDKTRRMYASITAADYSDGHRARALAENVRRGLPISPVELVNAFDPHLGEAGEAVGQAMARCRKAGLTVCACGSGPAFFSPAAFEAVPATLLAELAREWGVRAMACRTLGRDEALAVREV